ncbi:hypothetical protein OR1_04062 [Geobacter sp. OR-1]|nr:hypothetical protein OR1_04062 [Geobacter sp. OR-1]
MPLPVAVLLALTENGTVTGTADAVPERVTVTVTGVTDSAPLPLVALNCTVGGDSLSVIVRVAVVCVPSVAPEALLRVRLTVSFPSYTVSLVTGTVKVLLAESPLAQLSVPLAVV